MAYSSHACDHAAGQTDSRKRRPELKARCAKQRRLLQLHFTALHLVGRSSFLYFNECTQHLLCQCTEWMGGRPQAAG